MSPQAGFVLLDQIAPRLRAIIPNSVKPVGGEDHEELIQDALCVAAKMLHDLEQRGKTVTPGNITYYTVLHMKSGRRSHSAGRTDVMGSGTQMDGKSAVHSFAEPAGIDENGEEIPLEEMLASEQDDPAQCATRVVDWDQFLKTHNPRYRQLVEDMACGVTCKESACRYGFSASWGHQLKLDLAADLREYFGVGAIEDSLHVPAWRGNIMVDHEKAACRADRRHS